MVYLQFAEMLHINHIKKKIKIFSMRKQFFIFFICFNKYAYLSFKNFFMSGYFKLEKAARKFLEKFADIFSS